MKKSSSPLLTAGVIMHSHNKINQMIFPFQPLSFLYLTAELTCYYEALAE